MAIITDLKSIDEKIVEIQDEQDTCWPFHHSQTNAAVTKILTVWKKKDFYFVRFGSTWEFSQTRERDQSQTTQRQQQFGAIICSRMGVLTVAEKRKATRENCRLLRPYILWRRRKENAVETGLLFQIKEEEEKKKRDQDEKKRQAAEERMKKLQDLRQQLNDVKARKTASKEKLKLLQEEKHDLFSKLKRTLMAKETEKREKYFNEFYGSFTEYGQPGSHNMQYVHPSDLPGQLQSHPKFTVQDQSSSIKYGELNQAPVQEHQQWQWNHGTTRQLYPQGL
eukprot:gene4925-5572_t